MSVTLSDVFLSVLSGTTPHASATRRLAAEPSSPEQEPLRRCVIYRSAFPMTEIALPALALRNPVVAKWVRDQNVAIEVRSSDDLGVSLAPEFIRRG